MSLVRSSTDVVNRASATGGGSAPAIHRMVVRALAGHAGGGTLLDVGCGSGGLWRLLAGRFDRYVGVDAVRYDGLPEEASFFVHDLDTGPLPVPDGYAAAVAAIEIIEHLENPRVFFRELVRVAAPGAWIVVSTPNQLSVLGKLTLVVKNEFNAFQASAYPAHITALLESDLERIARECGLVETRFVYSEHGRIPLTPFHYPNSLSRRFRRGLSDNLAIVARKAAT